MSTKTNGALRRPRYDAQTKQRAATLRAAGWTYPQIAEEIGASEGTVYYWLNPKHAEAVKERSASWKRDNPDRRRESQRAYDHANRRKLTKKDMARRKKARQALQRAEKDRTVTRNARQGAAEAYALVRRALQALENPRNDHPGARAAARDATAALHRAEDKIADAVKVGA